jgi:methylated-DNA-[protein]-cysteine S-methyltransferase
MNLFFSTFPTPIGPFAVAVDSTGAIVATAFGSAAALRRRLRAGPLTRTASLVADDVRTRSAREQIVAYLRGERNAFELPLLPHGTVFQQRVWAELQRIPLGETRSYLQLARTVRSSPRAVGRANATNPICLIVPCHRVIGADGSLTGFAFGEEIKRKLLERERAMATAA